MNFDSKFSKVIRAIPEDERLSLLDKFTRLSSVEDLNLDKNNVDSLNEREKEMKKASQDDYIDSIYKKTSLINKIIIFFITLMNGKSREEIVLEGELKSIKRHINLSYGGFVDFESEKLTSVFIKEMIDLPKKINEIRKSIDAFFTDPIYYYGFLNSVIESSFPEKVLNPLKDLLPENVEVRMEYMDKSVFVKEKDKRLKKFFSQFDSVFLEKLVAQFNNFDIFLRILNFDYEALLRNFFIFDINEPITSNNNCEFTKAEELLSKFYRLISSVNFTFEEINFIYEMIDYSNNILPNNKNILKDSEVRFKEEEMLKLKDIFQKTIVLKDKIPFNEIFRYFRKDLLYKVKPVKINIGFLEIYKEYKKTVVNRMWEDFYEKIRIANLSQILNNLFKTEYSFDILHSFNVELKEKVEKLSPLRLRNVQSLNFITDFIKNIYKPRIEIIVNKILIDGVFKKDTEKSNLSVAYYTLTNFADKIKEFDDKFQEEKELGKKINTTLKRIATDAAFKASLINLVTDINEESNKIAYEANECFALVDTFFKNLIDVNNSKVNPLNNLDRVKIPGRPNSFVAVENAEKYLEQYTQINQLIRDIY
ncbi:MAG TPA: DUF5312 family protein [Spirochaetota bacterium]|nr:DUF5312 family protein [Spirochaetota bacterium]